MSSPKVSIIIPVYNTAPYLRRCLDSVCGQTLQETEIICVNDCSTDDSGEILKEYATRDSRVHVITHEKNSGEGAARNTGLAVARGNWLGFVDSDDYVAFDFYEKLYNFGKKNASDIIKGKLYKDNFTNLQIKINKMNFSNQFWTAIYKTKLIKKFDIKFLENCKVGCDLVFLQKSVCITNSISTLNNAIYYYIRRDDSSDSKILSFDKLKDAFMALDNCVSEIESAALEDNDYLVAYKKIFDHYSYLLNKCEANEKKSIYKLASNKIIGIFQRCRFRNRLIVELMKKYPWLIIELNKSGLVNKKFNIAKTFNNLNLLIKIRNKMKTNIK